MTTTDPESRTGQSWCGRYAWLKGRGLPDDHPDVIEARQAVAYHRLARDIDRERGELSRAGVDRLRAKLSEAVAS